MGRLLEHGKAIIIGFVIILLRRASSSSSMANNDGEREIRGRMLFDTNWNVAHFIIASEISHSG